VRKFLAREPGDPTTDHRHVVDLVRIGDLLRSRWSEGRRPRGMRDSKARAGHRAGPICPLSPAARR
jgi:hypothetical protein